MKENGFGAKLVVLPGKRRLRRPEAERKMHYYRPPPPSSFLAGVPRRCTTLPESLIIFFFISWDIGAWAAGNWKSFSHAFSPTARLTSRFVYYPPLLWTFGGRGVHRSPSGAQYNI